MKTVVTFILLMIMSIGSMAQSNFSFAAVGSGFDFGDGENKAIYKLKAGDGSAILEPGVRLGLEVYASPVTSLKLAQTIKIDEMKHLAMSSQVMLRFRIFKLYKHSLTFGFGPSVFYRKTWTTEDNYIDEGVYKNGEFQSKVNWLSAELEYNYWISKFNDLSFSVIHLNPEAVGFAVGIKHWFTRKSNKCGTCPSFK